MENKHKPETKSHGFVPVEGISPTRTEPYQHQATVPFTILQIQLQQIQQEASEISLTLNQIDELCRQKLQNDNKVIAKHLVTHPLAHLPVYKLNRVSYQLQDKQLIIKEKLVQLREKISRQSLSNQATVLSTYIKAHPHNKTMPFKDAP